MLIRSRITGRPRNWFLLLSCMLATAGCAPKSFLDGVAWKVRRAGMQNAAFQGIGGRPYLRVDSFVLDQLNQVEAADEVVAARVLLNEFLSDARRLGQYAVNNEIDRLAPRDVQWLWSRFFVGDSIPTAMRQAIRERFFLEAEPQFAKLSDQVRQAGSLDQLHKLARSIGKRVKPSPKDRRGSGVLLAIISASIKEERGHLDRGGLDVDVYEPGVEFDCASPVRTGCGTKEDELLAAYAPIIVQERSPTATYDPSVDQIGTVRALGRPGRRRVEIDTRVPSVYAYPQYTWANGQPHLQLTYTYWFPEHPKLKAIDAEAGKLEGVTLRITLDMQNKPAFFETVLNCGCFHRAYPAARVEEAACTQNGSPIPGKRLCAERVIDGRIDWVMPEVVVVEEASSARPILFSRAGWHGLAGVSFELREVDRRSVLDRRSYRLRCYEDLERLPLDGGFVSMFESNGLVRGAKRLEGWLLAPSGMLSAGQPRQRGTQLLHWDQYDFDDPHLLEQCVRLPSGF